MSMKKSRDFSLSNCPDQEALDKLFAFVIDNPRASRWMKDALMDARTRDPNDVLNEVAILRFLLEKCAEYAVADPSSG